MEQVLSLVGSIVPLGEVDCTAPRSLFPTADIELIRGCESYCTYCIVPRSRGPEVVVDADEVLHRAERAIGSGFSELLFLGQNINSYRSSLGGLVETMSAVDELGGNFWFWFLSSHPANFTPEEVRRVMGLRHIEHRMHLPLQSGSDRILEQMNRRYSICLLYTSDAADDLLCVDLGGRRIIKTKKRRSTGCTAYTYPSKNTCILEI